MPSTRFDLGSTATAGEPAPAPSSAHQTSRRSRALGLRRGFLVASPVLAGLLCIAGALADPAPGVSGKEMLEVYFENGDVLQFKSLFYHWSYAFWCVPAMLVVPLIRQRGAALATLAGFVGFVGLSTMPGLLIVDFFDSAIGAAVGMEGHEQVMAQMDGMWGVPAFALPGLVGLFLALPLATAALWRAGLARWWAFAAAVGAFASFTVSNATWPGAVGSTAFLAVVALALHRATETAYDA